MPQDSYRRNKDENVHQPLCIDYANVTSGDVEHPRAIPMDLPSSHQVPSGPMTRSRARALKTEVTSLLSQFHFDEHETWLLPQTETLCILRYQGVSHGEARKQGKPEVEDMREDGEEKRQVPDWPDDLDDGQTIRTEPRRSG